MLANDVSLREPAPILSVINGIPSCLSTEVAHHFEKVHRDVVRAIENLLPQLPPEGVRNFAHTPLINEQNGQTYPAYRLTRDGFTLLAMGFTGSKALAFKLAYIDAFNKMEHMLRGGDAAVENKELRQMAEQLIDINKTLVTMAAERMKSRRQKEPSDPRKTLLRALNRHGGWVDHSYLLRHTHLKSAAFRAALKDVLANGLVEKRFDGRSTFYKVGPVH